MNVQIKIQFNNNNVLRQGKKRSDLLKRFCFAEFRAANNMPFETVQTD